MSGLATPAQRPAPTNPRLFYIDPLLAGPVADWPELLAAAASLGFSHAVFAPPFAARSDIRLLDDPERPHDALGFAGDATELLAAIDGACRAAGLGWMLDLRLDAVAAGGRLAREHDALFAAPDAAAAIVPGLPDAPAQMRQDADPSDLASFWSGLLNTWSAAGAAGFRLHALGHVAPDLIARLTKTQNGALLVGVLDDVSLDRLEAWRDTGLDRAELSLDRWDEAAPALLARAAALSRVAPVLAAVERPFGPRFAAAYADRAAWIAASRRVVHLAASLGDGWLLPLGFPNGETIRMDPRRPAFDDASRVPVDELPPPLIAAIREANEPALPFGPPQPLPSAAAGVEGVVRRSGHSARVTMANRTGAAVTIQFCHLIRGYVTETGMATTLAAGEARSQTFTAAPLIRQERHPRARTAAERARSGRVAIEAVTPSIDDGRFAVKRTVGDVVTVECDVICDGHDKLAAALQSRPLNEPTWRETRMAPLGNDRWQASFETQAVGRWVFRIEAWRDAFATFRDELSKKNAAGIDVSLEVREGRELVAGTVERHASLSKLVASLDAAATLAEKVEILLSEESAETMRGADPRPFLVQSQDFPVDADRPQAGCAAWYEIFPRSMAGDGVRHGTFRDVIRQLPRIRDMGFDVLYFPPISPIGRINRKGRNNSLTPAPDDPGSPYAIGGIEGGHDALHPELGSFEDFEALRQAARDMDLELAIDFAIQCAPDHPWLAAHKGWFDWRPDGSLRYAENPPKKYEDIVNVDFYAPDAVPDLWVALSDVVFFWLERGVRIFRVDNPHTKPLPFWEWLIFEVRSAYPDAIFLAEAFTRPKVMNRLGKIGFHQSYTYFTWRNTKAELQEYLTQLDTTEAREFFRPNFFVNTPDINPPFLQTSGRAGFLIRAALAATLSGSWGVYCGFELCEATPVPGREEYLDSEKYQLRAWDWDRPGNIVAEIAQLNAVRRQHPCLWSHLGVTFLPSDDDQVMFFEKATADRSDVLLIAITLDPRGTHSAAIELPLWRWGLSDQATIDCRDVLHDTTFTLAGKWQRVALSPEAPYTIWHARPQGPYTV